MREIKFRAWEPLNRKMHIMDFALYEVISDEKKGFALPLGQQCINGSYATMNLDALKIMQYTGFKDCEDVEVYEDDIIELTLNFYDEDSCISEQKLVNGLVVFDSGQWHVRVRSLGAGTNLFGQDSRKVRVVGNIHEHPEVLMEESE